MRDLVTAYIGLGANLGSAAATVRAAMQKVASITGVTCTGRSTLYASAPVDSSGPDYVNAVMEVQTLLSAPQLLVHLQAIELEAGRQRPYRNAPRTLDLDLLLYGQSIIHSAALTVPHPRMWARAFVVLPLAEIAPALVSTVVLQAVGHQAIGRIDP